MNVTVVCCHAIVFRILIFRYLCDLETPFLNNVNLPLSARVVPRVYDVRLVLTWICGCVVRIVIRLRIGQQRSCAYVLGRGKTVSFLPKCPELLGCSFMPVANGHR